MCISSGPRTQFRDTGGIGLSTGGNKRDRRFDRSRRGGSSSMGATSSGKDPIQIVRGAARRKVLGLGPSSAPSRYRSSCFATARKKRGINRSRTLGRSSYRKVAQPGRRGSLSLESRSRSTDSCDIRFRALHLRPQRYWPQFRVALKRQPIWKVLPRTFEKPRANVRPLI